MACHVGTSKYSRDAHKDKFLQFVCVCVQYFVLIIWWLTRYSINVYLMLQMLVGHSLSSGEMFSIDSLLWLGLNDTLY